MAMLSHLLALLGKFLGVAGFIGPLIIYLIKKDDDEFVAFHSLQALYWELVFLVIGTITCGIGFIVALVFNIILLIKANNGEWAEYPVIGKWALK